MDSGGGGGGQKLVLLCEGVPTIRQYLNDNVANTETDY